MLCEEIMKREVECALPDDSVEDAALRMRDGNLGFLPVCDETRAVLGTLTDRDITIRVVAEHRSADIPVKEVMTNEVVACKPDDDVETAGELMSQHRKSRIMCVEDGKLVGVISLSDIAQHEDTSRAARWLKQISEREALW